MVNDLSLAVFFTGGVGLKTWADVGNLNRELAIYKRLKTNFREINLVTYGGNSDERYSSYCKELNLLSNPWIWNASITKFFVDFRYHSNLKQTDIFKTNQIIGSEIPLWLKDKYNKKLIVRCGYLLSDFVKKGGAKRHTLAKAMELERQAFTKADAGVVTSNWQRDQVIRNYNLPPEKIHVIPNYVMTDIFRPISTEKLFDLIFIGRCSTEKNIKGLLQAMSILKNKGEKFRLLLIGSCIHDSRIRTLASDMGIDIVFQGNVQNFQIPELLNSAKCFILPSFYEGHPKTLLEAMSSGLPCIGTDVQGISDDIIHGETGYLCKTDPVDIAEAIQTVLYDETLRQKMGKNARQYILDSYSLDIITEMELKLMGEVMDCR